MTRCGFGLKIFNMNPHAWLEWFVLTHQVQLAQVRGYLDDAVAEVLKEDRRRFERKCPPGEVLAMGVRDRTIETARNAAFSSGALRLVERGNRGLLLLDRDRKHRMPVRRWPADQSGVFESMGGSLEEHEMAPALFRIRPDAPLGQNFRLALYWFDHDGGLDDVFAVLVKGFKSPADRSVLYARVRVPAYAEIATLHSITAPPPPAPSVFAGLVQAKNVPLRTGTTGSGGPSIPVK